MNPGISETLRSVQRHFRYARTPEQEEFLKLVATTSGSRSLTMKGGFILWRAQRVV